MNVDEHGDLLSASGRVGHCDGRNYHGCGRTHVPPEQPDDAISWYFDERCRTWRAPRHAASLRLATPRRLAAP